MKDNLGEEAFTLVEILLTITTGAAVFLMVSNFFLNAHLAMLNSRERLIANNLGQLKMEELILDIGSKSQRDGEKEYSYKIIQKEVKEGLKELRVRVYFRGEVKSELVTFH